MRSRFPVPNTDQGASHLTPTIALDLIASIVAIGLVAAAMRLAYLTAGGRFDEAPAPAVAESGSEELARAA